jgi:hypothetical protein
MPEVCIGNGAAGDVRLGEHGDQTARRPAQPDAAADERFAQLAGAELTMPMGTKDALSRARPDDRLATKAVTSERTP